MESRAKATRPQGPFRAIGIVSGGLDSLLAVRLIQRMGIRVSVLHFVIGFEPPHLNAWIDDPDTTLRPSDAILATGAEVEVHDIRTDYMPLLAAPPHGYGGNCNPCVDCHAMMLAKAKERMEATGASFVFSGEVLGQRPMSQNRQALGTVAVHSALGDRLVRPLSGALLPATAPEREGVFSRDQLLDIQGRTRRRQQELAVELGVTDYPSPAGGCLLTDPQFSVRLRDLFERRPDRLLRVDDPLLLFVGRHIVLPDGSKVVIGRDHRENGVITRFAANGPLLEARDHSGPTALVEGEPSAADIQAAARLVGRYGKGRTEARVAIQVRHPSGRVDTLEVEPGDVAAARMLM